MPHPDDETFDVDQLLNELERKKDVLDRIILGLERDVQSGDEALAESVGRLLQEHSGPLTDLAPDAQCLLLQLATKRRRGARGVREQQSDSFRQAAQRMEIG